jgi:hypothetical protein
MDLALDAIAGELLVSNDHLHEVITARIATVGADADNIVHAYTHGRPAARERLRWFSPL